ncbi:MAG: hypothetical protein CVV64_07150 [Candidatus Wallbacteria bacterium HGW-Wallbacteria-1]|jgi:hypothetical protein|uniref:Uncharacterized protein n=1 Tax=Candidatus Wallbacteria bacterium HGW-Wallbacteria-1 TaxID=2013854 RepID=A0A2N1PT61_9BACT|nr:MAG: hypothetical protein CVV64_07150 [Candidatus Wallbacteria bacterium HGW-Wallbacteria-1]
MLSSRGLIESIPRIGEAMVSHFDPGTGLFPFPLSFEMISLVILIVEIHIEMHGSANTQYLKAMLK